MTTHTALNIKDNKHAASKQLMGFGQCYLALLDGNVVCDLGGVGLVMHEQNLQLGSVVHNELLEAGGKNELGLLVGSVTDVSHRCVALEAPAHSAINAMGLAPRAIKAKPEIRLESVEGLVRTLLHDVGAGSRLRSHGELGEALANGNRFEGQQNRFDAMDMHKRFKPVISLSTLVHDVILILATRQHRPQQHGSVTAAAFCSGCGCGGCGVLLLVCVGGEIGGERRVRGARVIRLALLMGCFVFRRNVVLSTVFFCSVGWGQVETLWHETAFAFLCTQVKTDIILWLEGRYRVLYYSTGLCHFFSWYTTLQKSF